MPRVLILSFAAVLALGVAACSYPVSMVSQGTKDGLIWISGAPAGARVLVDEVDAGEAARFDGRLAGLAVTPGRHSVEIVSNGNRLYSQTLMVASGSRVEVKVR